MNDDWFANFRNPPSECRPALQWSWNGAISAPGIARSLADFQDKGIGGFFTHARPGLELGYLSQEWFDLWETAAAECKRRGMIWNIYDEYTCPGGHAGGHVVADASHVAGRELRLVETRDRNIAKKAQTLLGWFDEDGTHAGPPEDGAWRIAALLCPLQMNPAKGGFPMPDLTHPDAVRSFIRTTHDQYRRVSGKHFGETVRYCFCDEPSLYHSDGLTLNPTSLREFEREHGYKLEEHLDALCFGIGDSAKVRYDFWKTMRRLFDDNFFKKLFEWCGENHLGFTGHVMENQWPKPNANPDSMATYRWMHAPGNDLLGFQFVRSRLRKNGLYLLNLKELSSAAAQLGRDREVMVESSGADGFAAAFALFKTCEDFLLAFGVTIMDPHLSHYSLGGARKYDWAQTLSPHSPWWDCYRTHSDHVARVIAAQREGKEINRVLVLHPTLSGWLDGRPDGSLWKASGEVDPSELKECTEAFYLDLYAGQIDFDLGDEILLGDVETKVEGGKFLHGMRAYDLLVLPPIMKTWTESTLAHMTGWLEAGGKLFAAGPAPTRVDGRLDDRPAQLQKKYSDQWKTCPDNAALVRAVRETLPPYLAAPDGSALPENLVWRRTQLPDGGTLWFFCAPWETEGVKGAVKVTGSSAVELDTATGEMFESESESQKDSLVFDLDLSPRSHRFFLVDGKTEAPAKPKPSPLPRVGADALRFVSAERTEPNLLLLDYCRLAESGNPENLGKLQGTAQADAENWRRHGFDGNPWQMGHQFKRNWQEYPFPPEPGCVVAYDFEIALDGIDRESLEIVVERPWLYDISLNGKPLPEPTFRPWFDEEYACASISAAVQDGPNRLTMRAREMAALVEIMPVYLRGDFHVEPLGQGFRAVAPKPLTEGDLTADGLPFYRGWLRYEYRFTLDAPAEKGLRLALPRFEATAARAWLDDRSAIAPVLHPPFEANFPGTVSAGEHTLTFDLATSLRNMAGPHHFRGASGPWAWLLAPPDQPAGKDYDLDSFGVGAPANPIISNPSRLDS